MKKVVLCDGCRQARDLSEDSVYCRIAGGTSEPVLAPKGTKRSECILMVMQQSSRQSPNLTERELKDAARLARETTSREHV